MTIRLYDPGGASPGHSAVAALRLESLQGKRIAILANGKHNGDVLARETAKLFEERHGCAVVMEENKGNATRICPPEILAALTKDADFLITAVGD